MSYVKWVSNSTPGDGVTQEILNDGELTVTMGVPVQLNADVKKDMESRGRVFETSTADEAKAAEAQAALQPVGNDVVGTAPVFADTSGGSNQATDDTDQGGSGRSRS